MTMCLNTYQTLEGCTSTSHKMRTNDSSQRVTRLVVVARRFLLVLAVGVCVSTFILIALYAAETDASRIEKRVRIHLLDYVAAGGAIASILSGFILVANRIARTNEKETRIIAWSLLVSGIAAFVFAVVMLTD